MDLVFFEGRNGPVFYLKVRIQILFKGRIQSGFFSERLDPVRFFLKGLIQPVFFSLRSDPDPGVYSSILSACKCGVAAGSRRKRDSNQIFAGVETGVIIFLNESKVLAYIYVIFVRPCRDFTHQFNYHFVAFARIF